jgi:predicted MFS family arabinose efflux permease
VTWALAAVVFAVGVDNYIVAAILPAVADDLHEPIAAVGLLASAYSLPTALLAPVFGPLSDRRGRRFAMLLGLGLFCVAAGACIVAPTLPTLLLARALNGLGAAICLPAVFALAGDLPDARDRVRTISFVAGMFPLSTLLGLPLGALAGVLAGWRASFAFVLLVAIVALALVARFCPETRKAGVSGSYLAPYRVVLERPRALLVMLVTLVWFMATFGLFVYVSEFVHRSFGIPANEAGLVYVVVGLVGLAATRVSGRLMMTVGPRRLVLGAIATFVCAALVLPQTTISLPLAVLTFAVWAFGTWVGIPAIQSIVAGLSDTARGTMLSLNTSAQNLGGVIGPALTGRVIETGGFALAGPYAAVVGTVALVIGWFALPRPASEPATDVEAPLALR